ncbi:O-succinylbenzoic acid--CoA ligase (OSB-CoA synthetase) [Synechococcus sp. BIOS-E4-1]|uniref:AMP-binding protein n=1 Tax=Synechococcus sp. BIOS-E4-1 TaxID=1400864 RepID=UPI001646F2B8|nr:AMP-binding protein [Synechococcus sp. BIOS-E4-1]QNI56628.1 O-succinylbenzoic acid--CoA ligase (OSB-CoA synthetase) [Synechococcus sp. BIOS-E4-1]
MVGLRDLHCDPAQPGQAAAALELALADQVWVRLIGSGVQPERQVLDADGLDWPPGPGLVLSTGGSSGGRQLCLHPLSNLDRSARACGSWLKTIGLDPASTLVWNPLPFQHVSGLMPWWRARQWGADHAWISPALIKQPAQLLKHSRCHPGWQQRPMVLSLVPTQLRRLLAEPCGRAWLCEMALIWVGGAALPDELADQSRDLGIRLAPCYGATETAAMVTAQAPLDFLAGMGGCGRPLDGVRLRVNQQGALAVHCNRLAVARLDDAGVLCALSDGDGWWHSADLAELEGSSTDPQLHLLGRIDHAIQSGGVTVFPSQLEQRLLMEARKQGLPLDAVLLLGVVNREWGQRLVALVRWSSVDEPSDGWDRLHRLVSDWPAPERPLYWVQCQELQCSAAGKWERPRWQNWLTAQQSAQSSAQLF